MKSDLLKIESPENWEKAKNFVPKLGQIIIYDGVKENNQYIQPPQIKIGDGITKVNDLPFEARNSGLTTKTLTVLDTDFDVSQLTAEYKLLDEGDGVLALNLDVKSAHA